MPVYKAPTRDARFVIDEVIGLAQYSDLPGFADVTADVVEAVLEEAGKFAAEVLAPLNRVGDSEGCTRNADSSVTTPTGFAEAYRQFREAGWGAVSQSVAWGGQGLPLVLGFAIEEFLCGANVSFSLYAGLTGSAITAIDAVGTPNQKQLYLPRMTAGEWLGTMNLTESHAGTDLGQLRTRAEPQADGTYAITGTKIFISAGEHDLTDNIIHLVLAKTPGAPDTAKGISLFLVPKRLVGSDGALGERNTVSCGALEHKMGIHGISTCVMNYDAARGWLLGEENRGLAAMFIMMNSARLGVGIQGLGQAEVAYQNGAAYALDRRQGRALTGAVDPQQAADLLVVHPDVRRMLMDAKAFTEGMRALTLWTGMQVELSEKSPDAATRQAAGDLVGLLTPVIKGYGTDKGFDTAVTMQQVWGGHGYIAENGMEQFVRDARIAMLYEGTNGIQAMDLVGRKLPANGGRAIQSFFAMVDGECATARDDPGLTDIATRLAKANGEMKAASLWLLQNAPAKPDQAGAAAYAYLHMAGIVALGMMWLRMARVAGKALADGAEDTAFYDAKLMTARYFAERSLPDAGALRRKIEAGSDSMMAMPAEAFATS